MHIAALLLFLMPAEILAASRMMSDCIMCCYKDKN